MNPPVADATVERLAGNRPHRTTPPTGPPHDRDHQPRIARLPGRSLIMLDGADALRFLDGLVSGDLDPVAEGHARYGALLTPRARSCMI
ncbi:hypothetical protein ACFQ4K_24155 [Tistrella bauzanensis]